MGDRKLYIGWNTATWLEKAVKGWKMKILSHVTRDKTNFSGLGKTKNVKDVTLNDVGGYQLYNWTLLGVNKV